ncbi:MAG: glycosyltransferase [Candidatus Eisenbacteria sp.]|nr:glycosyltransferase [Candidatus Eisenbacteria bacterium]
MQVLILTNLYPSDRHPARGTFIHSQVRSLTSSGVKTHVLTIEGWRSRLAYLRAVAQLRREIRSSHYDLIHAHYGFSGWIALCQKTVPVVISFMGDDLLGTPGSDGSIQATSRLYAWINRKVARRYDAVIVKSKEMHARLGLSDAHVVPNGVDMDLFRQIDQSTALRHLNLHRGPARILFAADPAIPGKRYELACRAVDILGERRACELHTVYGRPQEELVYWLNACDALILPSKSEGSPNIVKEAMACNLPVVATCVGDVVSLFARCPGNRVVPCAQGAAAQASGAERCASALADALGAVLTSGRTDCRDAMADLSMEAVARRLCSIYEGVLAGGSKQAPRRGDRSARSTTDSERLRCKHI